LAVLVLLRPGVDAQVHLTVLVVPAVLRLAALAEHVPWRATVELDVLGHVVRSVLVVQLPAQLLTVLAGRLSGVGPEPWLAVVAVLAVGVLGWVLLRTPAGPR
ncbi:hypothetical protein PU560_13395, partial [Georgenia sp. 10Sc9-8]|nr:hypothetical protein [Georgenia halotolerans]